MEQSVKHCAQPLLPFARYRYRKLRKKKESLTCDHASRFSYVKIFVGGVAVPMQM